MPRFLSTDKHTHTHDPLKSIGTSLYYLRHLQSFSSMLPLFGEYYILSTYFLFFLSNICDFLYLNASQSFPFMIFSIFKCSKLLTFLPPNNCLICLFFSIFLFLVSFLIHVIFSSSTATCFPLSLEYTRSFCTSFTIIIPSTWKKTKHSELIEKQPFRHERRLLKFRFLFRSPECLGLCLDGCISVISSGSRRQDQCQQWPDYTPAWPAHPFVIPEWPLCQTIFLTPAFQSHAWSPSHHAHHTCLV